MCDERTLKMEYLNPAVEAEVNKQYKGLYLKHALWGSKKYHLPENYKNFAKDLFKMPFRSDDVFVSSFPRSGTTWTQELVWLVANDLDIEKANSIPLASRYTYLDETIHMDEVAIELIKQNVMKNPNANTNFHESLMKSSVTTLAETTSRRFVKTHLPLSLLPPNLLQEAKVVYVARDPRDVVVSYYKLLKSYILKDYIGDFKQFVDLFIKGLVDWAPSLEHVKEAWRQRDNPNLLFLFYEDLQKDLNGCIKKVAKFLGKKYTEEQIAVLAEHLSFDNFKKNGSVDIIQRYKDTGMFRDDTEFIRKGKSGGWRELFDEEITEKFNHWMREGLKDTDLVFPSN